MILANSLIKLDKDVAPGMQARILGKLEELDYRLLNIQIETYKVQAENDFEDCFGEEQSLYGSIEDPQELLSLILNSLSEVPDAVSNLVITLRGMLLIKGEPA